MTTVTSDALEFSREHIEKYYDSDFFPKPFEFEAIWHHWDDVKKDVMSRNVAKHWILPPRMMTVAKARVGYRVVHQLEPVDSLIYTALTWEVAEAVEAARMPVEDKVACSYRINIDDGSFYAGGSGW